MLKGFIGDNLIKRNTITGKQIALTTPEEERRSY
jgi:hypothetical protein